MPDLNLANNINTLNNLKKPIFSGKIPKKGEKRENANVMEYTCNLMTKRLSFIYGYLISS